MNYHIVVPGKGYIAFEPVKGNVGASPKIVQDKQQAAIFDKQTADRVSSILVIAWHPTIILEEIK